jgi:hypothetical protein
MEKEQKPKKDVLKPMAKEMKPIDRERAEADEVVVVVVDVAINVATAV